MCPFASGAAIGVVAVVVVALRAPRAADAAVGKGATMVVSIVQTIAKSTIEEDLR